MFFKYVLENLTKKKSVESAKYFFLLELTVLCVFSWIRIFRIGSGQNDKCLLN